MRLHSNFVYILTFLLLLAYSSFISFAFYSNKFGIIVIAPVAVLLTFLIYSLGKIITKFEFNLFLQFFSFIVIAEIIKAINFISFENYNYFKSVFESEFYLWTLIISLPYYLIFLLMKNIYIVNITDHLCKYETIWGEMGEFNLINIRILENKILPFWIPGFVYGYSKMASVTWEDEEMDMYSISFFDKSPINNLSALEILYLKSQALDNTKIRRYY